MAAGGGRGQRCEVPQSAGSVESVLAWLLLPCISREKPASLTSWKGCARAVYQRPSRDFRALGELPTLNLELLSTSKKW